MSLFDRRTLLILPFALAACGFTPVYAPGETAAALRGQISVQDPVNRESFLLLQELESRLGRGSGKYGLAFDLILAEPGSGLTPIGDISRFNLIGTVNYRLIDLETGAVIYQNATSNFTGYSATGDTVETLSAQLDARKRLMAILADQITAELFTQVTLPPQ